MSTLFVTGMFRSGTTLLGRMLHANPAIALGSDGLFPLFKHLRNAIARDAGVLQDDQFHAPLMDYYHGSQPGMLDAVTRSGLNLSIDAEELRVILDRVGAWCTDHVQYSPLLKDQLGPCSGETYGELLANLLDAIRRAYGDEHTQVTAFKEVWTSEFVWPLLHHFSDMKSIVVVRDPRAVFASKKHRNALYPPLFMARQWRKLAALAHLAAHDAHLGDRVRLVVFEQLIREPERTTRQLCDFLGVPWDEAMVEPGGFVNGLNEPWSQNTAYGKGKAAFNAETLDCWKTALTPEEIAFVEYLCWPEASLFGYEPTGNFDAVPKPVLIDETRLADWIKPFAVTGREQTAEQLVLESERHELCRVARAGGSADGRHELIKKHFLSTEIFDQTCGGAQ